MLKNSIVLANTKMQQLINICNKNNCANWQMLIKMCLSININIHIITTCGLDMEEHRVDYTNIFTMTGLANVSFN